MKKVQRFSQLKKQSTSHEHEDLYNLAINGNPKKIDPSFITDQWEKDYHQHVLNLSLKNGDSLDPMIVIEKKPVNDHKIEGTFYQTPSIINGMDVSKSMPAPNLEWSQDTLTFTSIKKTINLTLIKKEFPIEQFTGKTPSGHNGSFGMQVLYMRVPKDLKIISSKSVSVEYVK